MNYLAHAYLSFEQPGILTGNMISDFVKGKKKFEFTPIVQQGIALHRAIDDFTDFHPATQQAKTYFRKDYRLYAGAFVDVLYDHFLANDLNEFSSPGNLASFCQSTYQMLNNEQDVLPTRFLQMLPYMEQQNWLYNYRSTQGIEKSFGGLVRRAAYLTESATAFRLFMDHYAELGECYRQFFPELKLFALTRLSELNKS